MLTRYIYSLLLSITYQAYNENLSAFGYRKNNISFSSDVSYVINGKCTTFKTPISSRLKSNYMTEKDLSIYLHKIKK